MQADIALNPPTTFIGKLAQGLLDRVEKALVRYSIHGNPPLYDPALFPWAAELENEWRAIRAELDDVLRERDALPSFHELTSEVRTITTDDKWKTFLFMGYGFRSERNLRRCPATARALQKIPGLRTAFFSILAPGKHIPPHRGPYNGVLRLHLALKVPEPRDKVRIRVRDRICVWEEGKSLVFDDSFNHEVWNETDGERAVLFVDFARPCRFPGSLLNRLVLAAVPLLPMAREGIRNQRHWERRFYGKDARAAGQ